MLRIRSALAVLLTGPLLWSGAYAQEPDNPVIEWNRALLAIVRTPGAQPASLHSTRSSAVLHAAIYDALNSIDGHHAPYLVNIERIPEDTSQEAAADSRTAATPDQQLIGKFWGGQIQNYWNEIAQSAAEAHQLSLPRTARPFALLNFSLADSVIAFYDAKYTYLFWRPVTAIQEADIDGNPNTIANPTWLPQPLKTAGDPSYPGAHATISEAAAFVLDSFFGKQPIQLVVASTSMFTTCSSERQKRATATTWKTERL
jgi:hypothetical protein